jgi:hypothetical protein
LSGPNLDRTPLLRPSQGILECHYESSRVRLPRPRDKNLARTLHPPPDEAGPRDPNACGRAAAGLRKHLRHSHKRGGARLASRSGQPGAPP